MLSWLKAVWNWLPVIVRAIVLGFVLLEIGSIVTFLPLLGNLKFSSRNTLGISDDAYCSGIVCSILFGPGPACRNPWSTPKVLIVGTMFWVAHLDHGITVTHLPFQMSASIA